VALSAVGTLQTLIAHENEFDGFVVAVDRTLAFMPAGGYSKPVVGIGEASMYMACLLGHKFTSMTALWRMVP